MKEVIRQLKNRNEQILKEIEVFNQIGLVSKNIAIIAAVTAIVGIPLASLIAFGILQLLLMLHP